MRPLVLPRAFVVRAGFLLLAASLAMACGGGAAATGVPATGVPASGATDAPFPPTTLGPTGTPGDAASLAPLPIPAGYTTFTSTRYRYTLAHPTRWTVLEAPGRGGVHAGEPGLDTFDGRTGQLLTVAVEPVGGAATTATWTCAINRHMTDDHRLTVEREAAVTVSGKPGLLRSYHLVISPYVTHYIAVEVIDSGSGFTFTLESTIGNDAADEAMLTSILATVQLGDS